MPAQTTRVEKTATGLCFTGVIDHQSIPKLMSALPDMQLNEPILDLKEVSKIDSAGLAFLIHWGNEHLSDGQKVKLSGISRQAKQLIGIMGLEPVFELIEH